MKLVCQELRMTLKVIGTGFGRTGTDSMRKALNILGVGPTHHMHEMGTSAPAREAWINLVKGAKPDWDLLFDGYHACVDWPSAYYWRDLVKYYPDAKVLLLLIAEQVFSKRADDRDHAIDIYKRNIEEVIATVSADRLLVHNLGDGWEPLCRWLELPVPDADYPKGNATEEFVQNMRKNS